MGGYRAKSVNVMRQHGARSRDFLIAALCGVPAHLDRKPAIQPRASSSGVGVAWAITKISSSNGVVALVQTSLMLPVALSPRILGGTNQK